MLQWIEQRFLWILLVIFITLRLIYLDTTYLWADDASTLAITSFTPWSDLLQVVFERAWEITGAILPTLFDALIVNIFGPNVIALRLLSVFVSVLSFLLLYAVNKRLFPESHLAHWLPLFLFTFSVPSIIYSQQIQPSIYYFFATIAQLYVFIRLFSNFNQEAKNLYRPMSFFVLFASFVFFMNYMALFITFLLSLILTLRFYFAIRFRRIRWQAGILQIVYFALLHIPLLLSAYYILHNENTNPTRMYFKPYYSSNPIIFLRDTYDFISYHFNFVYEPTLYQPLGLNIFSLPFVPFVIWGIIIFMLRDRLHPFIVIIGIAFLFFLKITELFPYAGTRHTFTFAPFLYIFIAYALFQLEKSEKLKRFISVVFILLVLVPWSIWGWRLYEMRQSRIDLQMLADLADEYDVDYIVAFAETYPILFLSDYTQAQALNSEFSIEGMGRTQDIADINHDSPYLIVSVRNAVNATWGNPFGTFPSNIIASDGDYRLTTLIADEGSLPSDLEIAQSIYWPLNGFFVYLVEPNDSE